MRAAALFAALSCAATLAIRIPSPTGGYMNLGDTVVLLGAYLLGGGFGAAAGGSGAGAGRPRERIRGLRPGDAGDKGADGGAGPRSSTERAAGGRWALVLGGAAAELWMVRWATGCTTRC